MNFPRRVVVLMPYLSSLSNTGKDIVLDTSVVINLCSTGFVTRIISALPNRFVVTDSVRAELGINSTMGCEAGRLLDELMINDLVEVGILGQHGLEKFFELTGCGASTRTLADGEASTLAFAWSRGFAAVIDEKKALRICRDCLPTTLIATTIDILSLEAVKGELKENFPLALLNALRLGRMRVPPHQVDWIVESIGRQHAEVCVSLSRTLGSLKKN